jgi:uncharacterized membrane protein SirB2
MFPVVLDLPADELYLLVRRIHIACVIVTAGGFLLRGAWMLSRSPLLDHRLSRTLPHVNDSILLCAAVALAWMAHLNPLDHAWLMAKLIGLSGYILLGSIALRRGRTKGVRAVAFGAALMALGYIVAVALTRNPLPVPTEWPL